MGHTWARDFDTWITGLTSQYHKGMDSWLPNPMSPGALDSPDSPFSHLPNDYCHPQPIAHLLIPKSYHCRPPPTQSQERLSTGAHILCHLGRGLGHMASQEQECHRTFGGWMVGVSLLPTSIPGTKHILAYKLQSLGNPPFAVDCCSGPVGRKDLLTLTTTGAQGISLVGGGYGACMLAG